MLEKIGLPAKPSLRGNTWVVDASHCQGCSSQFTFLNRKHHCRRCGGIFCNACTQQRMVLRGQGESPVRICEPCKKLEEAARFEIRHGHRSRAGSSRTTSRSVDEVLNQVLGDDNKEVGDQNEDADLLGAASNGVHSGTSSTTPEELRQLSLEEKNRYKTLKGEGKAAEALKAFKRSKELERQAAALELQLRKNRKKALASISTAESQKSDDVSLESGRREKPPLQKGKEKDDLTAELRELGWSDVDVHDVEQKPAPTSLESELLSLLGLESKKTAKSKSSGVDKSQVVALKKKALLLKREGKLAEAKEELKKAKILEKQLEEQELLADADDSDDELSALIRSLDNEKQKDFSAGFDLDSGFDLSNLSSVGGDLGADGNFDVTDDDMNDPEIAAALQSLGWAEEPIQPDESATPSATVDREALAAEIHNLKREAVSQKQSGDMAGAMSLLKKAKNLEKDLDSLAAGDVAQLGSIVSHDDKKTPMIERKPAPKSRLMIQKELLAIKKKALALRREGKVEEADEELRKGKVLEQQLEEIDSSAAKMNTQTINGDGLSDPLHEQSDLSSVLAPADDEGDVTEQDLQDPTYLSLLNNLGWQDEENRPTSSVELPKENADASAGDKDASFATVSEVKPRRSKAQIQRELLGLKRKALALRRQGQEDEAEEVLRSAKGLEEQLAEMEDSKRESSADFSAHKADVEASKQGNLPEISHRMEQETTTHTPLKRPAEPNVESEKRQAVNAVGHEPNLSPNVSPGNQIVSAQQEILALKRKALALKREGKLAEAREELRKAKILERELGEDKHEGPDGPVDMEASPPSKSSAAREEHTPPPSRANEEPGPPHSSRKPMSSQERFKLQRECLSHKRNALKLRREGRSEEADAELEIAKNLEAQLEDAAPQDNTASTSGKAGPSEEASVEDFLDPQLLSALKAIGLQDVAPATPVRTEKPTPSPSKSENESSSHERARLEAQVKAEKMKALNLKRAGKQAEALDAFRRAKQMEKKLNSIPV